MVPDLEQWQNLQSLLPNLEAATSAISQFVSPGSLVFLGIVEEEELWASLVVRFTDSREVEMVTTARVGELTGTGLRTEALRQVEKDHGEIALSLFVTREEARELVHDGLSWEALRRHTADGSMMWGDAPSAVSQER